MGVGVDPTSWSLCTETTGLCLSQIQAACWPRAEPSPTAVYEDMCYSRRSTMSTPNHYQL